MDFPACTQLSSETRENWKPFQVAISEQAAEVGPSVSVLRDVTSVLPAEFSCSVKIHIMSVFIFSY